jgi:hypothetical protein
MVLAELNGSSAFTASVPLLKKCILLLANGDVTENNCNLDNWKEVQHNASRFIDYKHNYERCCCWPSTNRAYSLSKSISFYKECKEILMLASLFQNASSTWTNSFVTGQNRIEGHRGCTVAVAVVAAAVVAHAGLVIRNDVHNVILH